MTDPASSSAPSIGPREPGRRRFLVGAASVGALGLLAGASRIAGSAADGSLARWQGHVLGARAEIVLHRSDEDRLAVETPQRALDLAVAELRDMERLFSLYDPRSDLSRLNRMGTLFMENSFGRLMTGSSLVHEWTQGAFDPTVQPIFAAMAQAGGRLDPAELEAVSRNVGWTRVGWGRNTVSLLPGMAMTLNGIAQGFAADRVREVLTLCGYPDIVIDTGELLVGKGTRTIGVPDADGGFAPQEVRNAAFATTERSGFVFSDGAGHVLAPPGHEDGRAWDRVTVKARLAFIADGVSTALALAPDDALARRLVAEGRIEAAWLHGPAGTVAVRA